MLLDKVRKNTNQARSTGDIGPHFKTNRNTTRIQLAVGGGFVLIIAVMWIIGLTRVFTFIHLDDAAFDISQGKFMTGVVILVALPVMYLMRWLLLRLERSEDLMSVCAWCKKVDNNGEWLNRDEYFERRFQTRTTHSICGPCSNEFNSDLSTRALEN